MNTSILALRAITAEYFGRPLRFITATVVGILASLTALIVWLAVRVDDLWWFGLAVIVPLALVACGVLVLLHFLARRLAPRRLTRNERRAVKGFTDKISGLIERAGTPLPLTGLMVAKDVVRGRESRLIREFIDNSSTLRQDFTALRTLFDENTAHQRPNPHS